MTGGCQLKGRRWVADCIVCMCNVFQCVQLCRELGFRFGKFLFIFSFYIIFVN